jgi:hypothetical protein
MCADVTGCAGRERWSRYGLDLPGLNRVEAGGYLLPAFHSL